MRTANSGANAWKSTQSVWGCLRLLEVCWANHKASPKHTQTAHVDPNMDPKTYHPWPFLGHHGELHGVCGHYWNSMTLSMCQWCSKGAGACHKGRTNCKSLARTMPSNACNQCVFLSGHLHCMARLKPRVRAHGIACTRRDLSSVVCFNLQVEVAIVTSKNCKGESWTTVGRGVRRPTTCSPQWPCGLNCVSTCNFTVYLCGRYFFYLEQEVQICLRKRKFLRHPLEFHLLQDLGK